MLKKIINVKKNNCKIIKSVKIKYYNNFIIIFFYSVTKFAEQYVYVLPTIGLPTQPSPSL